MRNFVLLALSVFVCLLAIEGAARLVFENCYDLPNYKYMPSFLKPPLDLDPYEMASEKSHAHWVLRPGHKSTIEIFIADKEALKRTLTARILKEKIPGSNNSLVEIMRVNEDGFVGDALDTTREFPRILMLGDSVTFGSGSRNYPLFAADELEAQGAKAEVINGGVEGYALRNLNLEFDRYTRIKPDIVTIMIGWNDLFSDIPWQDDPRRVSRLVWLMDKSYRAFLVRIQDNANYATALYDRDLTPDENADEVQALSSYKPIAVAKLEALALKFTNIGARVYLMTLPSLFGMNAPSEKALKIGHTPYFTTNPYTVAAMVRQFNEGVRELSIHDDIDVIDINKWAKQELQKADNFFLDTVHLTDPALEMLGREIGRQLTPIVMDISDQKNYSNKKMN